MSAVAPSAYVPSDWDVSRLSTNELKALVRALGGPESRVPLELGELRDAGEVVVIQKMDKHSMRSLIERSGLHSRDCNTMELLRDRTREAMARLREADVPFCPSTGPRTLKDNQFPVTWRKFDVTFREASLGLSIALDSGGNLSVVRVSGDVPLKAGVKPDDTLLTINHCGFGDIYDQSTFEKDVLTRLKLAPRPLKLTFLVGDGRWPPTSHLSEANAKSNASSKQSAPSPPQTSSKYVNVRFEQRGTLGFSVGLNLEKKLEVSKVRQVAASPCWLAAVKPGDELVALNNRKFGLVEQDQFDKVVLQLKHSKRPMTLTFKKQKTKQSSSGGKSSAATGPAATNKNSAKSGGSSGGGTRTTSVPRATVPPVAPAGGSAPRAASQRYSTPAEPPTPPAEGAWKDSVSRSAAEALNAESPKPTLKSSASDVYHYDAVFTKQLLGIALALSRAKDDSIHVVVTEVRPSCTAAEIEVNDRLLKINGSPIGTVQNEAAFHSKILDKLKAAQRPLTLTFTSGVQGTLCFSQSYAQDLFDEIDSNHDGLLSQVELIKALRKHPELAKALDLPQSIRQEDGSRDKFTVVFHSLATRDDKNISKREWAHGLAKMAGETIV